MPPGTATSSGRLPSAGNAAPKEGQAQRGARAGALGVLTEPQTQQRPYSGTSEVQRKGRQEGARRAPRGRGRAQDTRPGPFFAVPAAGSLPAGGHMGPSRRPQPREAGRVVTNPTQSSRHTPADAKSPTPRSSRPGRVTHPQEAVRAPCDRVGGARPEKGWRALTAGHTHGRASGRLATRAPSRRGLCGQLTLHFEITCVTFFLT